MDELLQGLGAGTQSSEDALRLRQRRLVGDDPLPHRVRRNRQTLEMLVRWAAEQHVIPTAPAVEELFVPGTQHLE